MVEVADFNYPTMLLCWFVPRQRFVEYGRPRLFECACVVGDGVERELMMGVVHRWQNHKKRVVRAVEGVGYERSIALGRGDR